MGVPLHANQATLDYSGFNTEDVLSSHFRERIFHSDDLERLRDELKWFGGVLGNLRDDHVMHARLDESSVGVLQPAHQLDADDAGCVVQMHLAELRAPNQPEVAVRVSDLQPEEQGHEPVVHPPDDEAEDVVRPVEFVPLHDVDTVAGLSEGLQ